MTKKVRVTLRPADISYMMMEAKIPLASLHVAFNVDGVFSHQDHLHLPQTYESIPESFRGTTGIPTTSGNATTDALLQLARGGSVATLARARDGDTRVFSDNEDENRESNSSWDVDGEVGHNPKMVELLKSHSSKPGNVLSYHGTLGMFDRGYSFAEVFPNPCEFYRIASRSVGPSQAFERDREMIDFNDTLKRIRLEVF